MASVCMQCGTQLTTCPVCLSEAIVSDGYDEDAAATADHFGLGKNGPPHGQTVSGVGQGTVGTGAYPTFPVPGISSSGRRINLMALDDSPLERPDPANYFEASVEGTRQDYDAIAAKYRSAYHDATHTPNGVERSMNERDEARIAKLLGKLDRAERRYKLALYAQDEHMGERAAAMEPMPREASPCRWPDKECICHISGPHFKGA
jgi:hypothetical protein